MREQDLPIAIRLVRKAISQWPSPVVDELGKSSESPFKILVACILSLRTRDATTAEACRRLFIRASDPPSMATLSVRSIQKAIYPVGFFRTKAKQIKQLSEEILLKHQGQVPQDMVSLLRLPGVGRKTANLVLSVGFGMPGICVDIHVHRICNRWGYVRTASPDDTEKVLREKLPEKYWIGFNGYLVPFGQNQCTPKNPKCESCPLTDYCQKLV